MEEIPGHPALSLSRAHSNPHSLAHPLTGCFAVLCVVCRQRNFALRKVEKEEEPKEDKQKQAAGLMGASLAVPVNTAPNNEHSCIQHQSHLTSENTNPLTPKLTLKLTLTHWPVIQLYSGLFWKSLSK